MAGKWPLANGNYSTAANWNGGTLPVDGDDIYMDNRTITLDQTINLPNARLLTTQRSGGTAGGVLNAAGTNDITLASVVVGTTTVIAVQNNYIGSIAIPTITPSATTNISSIVITSVTGFDVEFIDCLFLGGTVNTSKIGLAVTGTAAGNITFDNCTATSTSSNGVIITATGIMTVSGSLSVIANASSTAIPLSITATNISGTLSGEWEMWNNTSLVSINAGGAGLTFNVDAITWGTVNNTSGIALLTNSSSAMVVTVNAPELTMHLNTVGPQAGYVNGTAVLNWNGNIKVKRCYGLLTTASAGVIKHTGEVIYDETSDYASGVAGNIVLDTVRAANGMLPTLVGSTNGNGIRFRTTSQIIGQDELGNTVILSAPDALADLPVPGDVRFGVVYNDGTQTGTYVPGDEIAADVWSYATRTITAGGLDAAGVRAAIGMASANLDTQLGGLDNTLAAVEASTSNIQSQVANLQFDGYGYLLVDLLAVNSNPSAAVKLATFADGGVASPSGFVNVASLAANCIGSAELAASAVTEIQSGMKSILDKLDTAMVLDGAVYQFTANALELAPTGGGGGSTLTGANTVSIAVQYASAAVEGAKVRLSRVGETGIDETDADGEVAFSADNGTWTVAITKPGFQFTPITLVVDGDEIVTYTLTAVSIPASTTPGTATGYLYRYDEENAVQAGIQFCVQLIAGPGTAGYSYDGPIRKETSAVDGLVAFTDLVRGATFRIWKGRTSQSDNSVTFVVPASGASFALPEVL